ncbi:MAG: hypothetical protein A2504_01820 [Bdellovibrionales bacterium RIFOXYD12_FULL_39_22]|nr:MAG: hypothetical protein A2385_04345 [Bdellovibrionales bacterium RIFOXYB1_FULL_39_21]OFZ42356.1 MAG: hypothetical protein A2485_15150 [Bdellovibrionales bacterium RIFOXYC12_FULL_39_17]OFZ46343.1 MAG: hypothetical protein A2404_13865 [Bdellovibrionales bacterium RIFOXYC1_FULL_39_130]OFZ75236.1 MAG: hypothetical protein A2560_15920 [Bdellovibrionales bacterium RIFOXYD1_FULL_39_84]OFZ93230.1 MAG: hypothetical protein A2504_01820 [Bdellovibrionales bacterium RIFOXYD12_FULL_39_22]HLE11060.1 hy
MMALSIRALIWRTTKIVFFLLIASYSEVWAFGDTITIINNGVMQGVNTGENSGEVGSNNKVGSDNIGNVQGPQPLTPMYVPMPVQGQPAAPISMPLPLPQQIPQKAPGAEVQPPSLVAPPQQQQLLPSTTTQQLQMMPSHKSTIKVGPEQPEDAWMVVDPKRQHKRWGPMFEKEQQLLVPESSAIIAPAGEEKPKESVPEKGETKKEEGAVTSDKKEEGFIAPIPHGAETEQVDSSPCDNVNEKLKEIFSLEEAEFEQLMQARADLSVLKLASSLAGFLELVENEKLLNKLKEILTSEKSRNVEMFLNYARDRDRKHLEDAGIEALFSELGKLGKNVPNNKMLQVNSIDQYIWTKLLTIKAEEDDGKTAGDKGEKKDGREKFIELFGAVMDKLQTAGSDLEKFVSDKALTKKTFGQREQDYKKRVTGFVAYTKKKLDELRPCFSSEVIGAAAACFASLDNLSALGGDDKLDEFEKVLDSLRALFPDLPPYWPEFKAPEVEGEGEEDKGKKDDEDEDDEEGDEDDKDEEEGDGEGPTGSDLPPTIMPVNDTTPQLQQGFTQEWI